MRHIGLVVLMVALVVTAYGCKKREPKADLYKQYKLAFVSVRDGNPEIYVMNADSSEQKNLTNHPAVDSGAQWSPDGSKIAFMSDRDKTYEIYVMNTDGSEQRNLTNSPSADFRASWSPDGRKIAFYSQQRDRQCNIYILPKWSPDGKKIAFVSTRDGNPELYVMNADGSEQKNMTSNPADEDYIYVINADGSEKKQLTNTGSDFSPVWSPVPIKTKEK